MNEQKSEIFRVRIAPSLLERLRQAANDDDRSASSLARRLIEQGLESQGRKEFGHDNP